MILSAGPHAPDHPSPELSPRRWLGHSAPRGLLCGLIFALAFAGVCGGLHQALPPPVVPNVSAKLAELAEHRDEYDALFLGSSRVEFHIIPALFDRVAEEKGQPVKSFNAGLSGMRPPEDSYFLEQILRDPPPHLRWVFIELAALRLNAGEDKLHTLRFQYWHDWNRLQLLARHAFHLATGDKKKRRWKDVFESLGEPLADLLAHAEAFFQNQTNLGRGTLLTARLERDLPPPSASSAPLAADERAGWRPTRRPQAMSPANQQKFEAEVAIRRIKPPKKDLGDPISQEALESMIAMLESRGVTVFLIVPPTTDQRKFYPRPERERTSPVLDFSDPGQYPALFESRLHFDPDHLNTAGAEVFSRALAERWLAALRTPH